MLLATVVFVALLLIHPSYKYISRDLPDETRFIFTHWNESLEQKYQLRFGATFSLLHNIAERTPPDAIIIMPPDSILLNKQTKTKFHKEIAEKAWAGYFLYPRKLVYEKEKNTNPYYAKATYVVILNGWGLDKIHYTPANKIVNGVIPINL